MRLANALILAVIVTLATIATLSAQDLDSPRCGTGAQQAVAAHSSLFDQMLSKMLAAENAYALSGTGFAEWAWEVQWLLVEGYQFWNVDDARFYYAQFAQLTAAEQAAWRVEVADSRARMIAIGLN